MRIGYNIQPNTIVLLAYLIFESTQQTSWYWPNTVGDTCPIPQASAGPVRFCTLYLIGLVPFYSIGLVEGKYWAETGPVPICLYWSSIEPILHIPCQLTHFFPGPSPILMKFSRLAESSERLTHTKFQLIIIIIEEATALQRFLKFIKIFDFGTQNIL